MTIELEYKGYKIQRTYCIINKDGTAEDYCFSMEEAKKKINKLELKSSLEGKEKGK